MCERVAMGGGGSTARLCVRLGVAGSPTQVTAKVKADAGCAGGQAGARTQQIDLVLYDSFMIKHCIALV